jgi:excisionase family DNA binding protein
MTLTQLTPLSAVEASLAQKSGADIEKFLNGEPTVNLTVSHKDGEFLEATLPTYALRILAHVLDELAQGNPITLIPSHAELTTSQAAGLLHVSRPFLIKMLEQGLIPYRSVGTKRRIRYADVRAYIEKEKSARRETLKELAAHDQEIGLYDLEDK